jgi:citrate synthase
VEDKTWKTSITRVEPNSLKLRGYPINELMGRVGFAQSIYLAILGELPNRNEAMMLDAILVSSIDHGVTPPSCIAARTVASSGAPLSAAVAAGVLAISRYHGGAIEDCMKFLKMAVERKSQTNKTPDECAAIIIKEYRLEKKRMPGYGHRFHTQDPRSSKLFAIAHDLGIADAHVEMAKAMEKEIGVNLGKKLPINVDGAIAALLCDMKVPDLLANAFFIMARIPGLVAHVYEEQTAMRPMRHINAKDHEYDGWPERHLTESE